MNATELKDAHGRTFPWPEPPDIPNLDCETVDNLMTFWALVHHHPVIVARHLFPAQQVRRVRATQDLGAYASNKAAAMGCRERGDIKEALAYEGICDHIYSKLPMWARW